MNSRRKALVLLGGMVSAAAIAEYARPVHLVSSQKGAFVLSSAIPNGFADWVVDANQPVLLPPPDQQAALDKIYNQILARTYVNGNGQRVMLSIAYGGDQSDGLAIHMPEVCYVGQGFQLVSDRDSTFNFRSTPIPVRRLLTTMGQRVEPITYWIFFGDRATISTADRRAVSIRFGLRRQIPEGMLIRVSSIDRNPEHAYGLHDVFLTQMFGAMTVETLPRFIGDIS
jgi:EpsI family protein